MNIGALIPARIGSKRLPKKNIIDLGGKPLVCWTIDVLLEANFFADITVSTESREVASIVQSRYSNHDVKVLMRPESLAGDDSPLSLVESHYLENRPELDWMGLFMPTMPFRSADQLQQIYYAILTGYPWRVRSYTTEVYPILDYYYPTTQGLKRFFTDPCFYCRMLSCTYMMHHKKATPSLWPKYGLSEMERTYIVHVGNKECIDIDANEDYETAKKMVSGYKRVMLPLKVHNLDKWQLIMPEGSDINGLIKVLGTRLDNNTFPILIVEDARPKLTFLSIEDGAQRRPWIDPQSAMVLHNEKVAKTGNMQYMPNHFKQSACHRIKRSSDNLSPWYKSDLWGGYHCIDGSAIPMERVLFLNELKKKKVLNHPYEWKK